MNTCIALPHSSTNNSVSWLKCVSGFAFNSLVKWRENFKFQGFKWKKISINFLQESVLSQNQKVTYGGVCLMSGYFLEERLYKRWMKLIFLSLSFESRRCFSFSWASARCRLLVSKHCTSARAESLLTKFWDATLQQHTIYACWAFKKLGLLEPAFGPY